jgi:hypothetical protein
MIQTACTHQTFGFQVGLGTAVGGEGEGSYRKLEQLIDKPTA